MATMQAREAFNPFKMGWQVVKTEPDGWVLSYFDGFSIGGTVLRKKVVYRDLAEAVFGWLWLD